VTIVTNKIGSLLIVGCGNMGTAMISGASRHLKDLRIIGFDPHSNDLQRSLASELNVEITADAAALHRIRADAVLLAVKPQVVHSVLAEFGQYLGLSLVISIVAGLSLKALSETVPVNGRVVRAMPNLPCAVGAGMTVAFAGTGASASDRAFVDKLFRAVGDFAWLEAEAHIDAATAISGSGPGFALAFAEHLASSGTQLGLTPELATQLARQTVIGTGTLLARDSRSLGALKTAVTSPGGTTQAGLAVLETSSGLPSCVTQAARAAHARAVELGALSAVPPLFTASDKL
jgi:pyrroline-5-carboxylate reductase